MAASCTSILSSGDFFQMHMLPQFRLVFILLRILVFASRGGGWLSRSCGMVKQGTPCLASNGVLVDNICFLIASFHFIQSCEYHFGFRFGLAIGMEYFGTSQYQCSVSGLLQIYIYIYIYI